MTLWIIFLLFLLIVRLMIYASKVDDELFEKQMTLAKLSCRHFQLERRIKELEERLNVSSDEKNPFDS